MEPLVQVSIRASNNLYTDYLYVGQRLSLTWMPGVKVIRGEGEVSLRGGIGAPGQGSIFRSQGRDLWGQVAVAAVIINRVLLPFTEHY